ncbi:MAG: hypothetical protein ACYTEU_14570 [Planctomycetota bacterium]
MVAQLVWVLAVKPRAAYNSTSAESLVVWEDHHWGYEAARDIYARRYGLLIRGTARPTVGHGCARRQISC